MTPELARLEGEEMTTWRIRPGRPMRQSNFDRFYYRIVEEDRGEPEAPGILQRWSVVAKVQGETQEECDERAQRIVVAETELQRLRDLLSAHISASECILARKLL